MEAHQAIRTLLLTEKGTRLSEADNKYIFKVARDANKLSIKNAVEELFGVAVVGVNTMHRQGKRKRDRRQRLGTRASWKRAIVTLKEGDSIDLT
ncbi:MAG: 50S ribosomal protein L23 [Verrucomicrobia bacterium]|nr:50S ribosomal protein L23 [Verrucomicrobiota bacterium]